MWSTIIGRQSAEPPMKSSANQTTRGVSMYLPASTISSRKMFLNPNFVNNFSSNLGLVDNSSSHDFANSCHKPTFNDEREKGPVVNPQLKEPQTGKETAVETEVEAEMCLKSKPSRPKTIVTKGHKMHIKKGTKQMGKQSRQNNKLREIRENIQQDLQKQFSDSTMDNSCSQSKPAVLCLNDFLKQGTVEADHSLDMRSSVSSRSRKSSVTDSEDSFIIFDNDTNEESVSEDEPSDDNEPACRRRKTSLCESEDSFIMFDRGDVGSMEEDDSEDDDDESSVDGDELECLENSAVESTNDEVDASKQRRKKVTFASDDKLCQVQPMIKWSFAYQAARKGQWEMCARDRCRFRDRIFRVECEINRVLNPIHRTRIYGERFVNL